MRIYICGCLQHTLLLESRGDIDYLFVIWCSISFGKYSVDFGGWVVYVMLGISIAISLIKPFAVAVQLYNLLFTE